MNKEKRILATSQMHVRSVYGGEREPIFSALWIVLIWCILWAYFLKNGGGDPVILFGIPGFLTLLLALPIVFYKWVAKLHYIGNGGAEEIKTLKHSMIRDGYGIVSSNKYSIEAYKKASISLIGGTKLLVFSIDRQIFGSAFKFGAPQFGYHYSPLYFGDDQIEYLKHELSANRVAESINSLGPHTTQRADPH